MIQLITSLTFPPSSRRGWGKETRQGLTEKGRVGVPRKRQQVVVRITTLCASPKHLLAQGPGFPSYSASLNPTSFCQRNECHRATRVRSHLGRPRKTRHVSPVAGQSFFQDPRPVPQHQGPGGKRMQPNMSDPRQASTRLLLCFSCISSNLATVAVSS